MKLVMIVLAVFISCGALAEPEIKGSPEDVRSIIYPRDNLVTINESAEETAYSDAAIVTLLVETESKLLFESMRRNSEIRAAIVQKIIAFGISPASIKNSKFSSSPQYGWFGKKVDAFKVVNRISIKIAEEPQLQYLSEVSDSYPESSISSTVFEHSKKDEYQQKVKEKALAKVMERKVFYEKSLGVKLIAQSFVEKVNAIQATEGAGDVEEIIVTGIRAGGSGGYKKQYAPEVQTPENSFDEIKYSSSVAVEFKVLQ